MPVNIRNLNSNVTVTDSNSPISEEMLNQIVQQAMIRLKQKQEAEKQLEEEQTIYDRMADY